MITKYECEFLLPPGRYIIGDPAYILPNSVLHTLNRYYGVSFAYAGCTIESWNVVVMYTRDGDYLDSDGYEYIVDTGCMSVVPIGLADADKLFKYERDIRIVNFPAVFTCRFNLVEHIDDYERHLDFGGITIDPKPEEEYE